MSRLFLLIVSLPLPSLLVAAVVTEEGLPGLQTLIVPFLVIILLVILNGLFVWAEFALMGVRPTQMEHVANVGNRSANYMLAILRSAEAQERYIGAAQVGISLASLGLGMYGEPQISRFVEPYLARLLGVDPHETLTITLGYLGAVGMLTYLHIVVGEMVPKSLALGRPAMAALAIAPFMRLTQSVFDWPVRILNSVGTGLLSLFRIPPAESHARLHSPEELVLVVSESAKGGG
jgi:CBS domain containing-hemolysin-like protein